MATTTISGAIIAVTTGFSTNPIFYEPIVVNPITVSFVLGVPSITTFSLKDIQYTYELVVTGSAVGLDDITVPMESFQARMKTGSDAYLAANIPSSTYLDAIEARRGCDMKVDLVYQRDGVKLQRGTIVSAVISSIVLYEGGKSISLQVSGYKAETFAPKNLIIDKAIYRAVVDGRYRYRLASPNIDLRPGDTVTIEGTTFVADLISYYINTSVQTMEIAEAE